MKDQLALVETNNALPFRFSEIESRRDNRPQGITLTWETFCARMSEPDRSRGKLSAEEYNALDSIQQLREP
jgi:hypothetical protein